jgi:hypothetical protein
MEASEQKFEGKLREESVKIEEELLGVADAAIK